MGTETPTNKLDTYIALQNEDGKIEVDLVTFREKGQQVRYLSFNIQQTVENAPVSTSISLDEEAFNKMKIFFKQLDWNS